MRRLDEALERAEQALEIVRELDKDLLVPHLNGEPYAEKPPLFYYVTYLSKKAFLTASGRFSVMAVRI
jgi:4-amino-4-deoxy-L-arabinose transferase-like glycosyltransferase